MLLWTLSASLVCEGRLGEARQLLEEGRSAEPSESAEWARRELFPDWHAGNFRAALTRAREIVASSGGEQTRRSVGELVFACFAALELDERAEATKLLARGRLALGGGEWLLFTDYWAWAEALLAEREGRRSEALSGLAEVVSKLMGKDALASAAFVLADLVELASEAGEVQRAREAAEQVSSIAVTIDRDLYSALAAYTAAWSSLAAGDPGVAADHARRAVELFADLGYRPLLGRSRYVLGRSLLRTDPAAATGALEEAAAVFEACGAVWRRQGAFDALRPGYQVAT
jgi:tetratricopeptide (TPR) repeat protein